VETARAERPIQPRMTHTAPPRFPADCAFVVQFAQPQNGAEARAGRIEHVVSGRARRFQDGTQLMAFVAEVLASLESGAAPAAPSAPAG
jgi:hypothetical protein